MFKFIFKWLLRLFLLAIVLVAVFLLTCNSILRVVIEHNIRAQTGMDAEIGRVKLGLTEPTLEIQNLKIFNPPAFGGTPFLEIPEIHVEYDRAALAKKEIHITLLRFNLGELDIVKNAAGKTNIFSLGISAPKKLRAGKRSINFKTETGYDFKGIDVLNVSVGTAKYIDLKDQRNNRTQKIDIENCIIKNVRSKNDLAGLAVFVGLRSGNFLTTFAGPKKLSGGNSAALQDILNLIGVSF
ncbi:MAG TPA: hypothetical protein VIK59_00080 [Verrucomicrobiae bacterium]